MPPASKPSALAIAAFTSPSEQEVLRLASASLPDRETAGRLFIPLARSRLIRRTPTQDGVSRRTQAIAPARALKLA